MGLLWGAQAAGETETRMCNGQCIQISMQSQRKQEYIVAIQDYRDARVYQDPLLIPTSLPFYTWINWRLKRDFARNLGLLSWNLVPTLTCGCLPHVVYHMCMRIIWVVAKGVWKSLLSEASCNVALWWWQGECPAAHRGECKVKEELSGKTPWRSWDSS